MDWTNLLSENSALSTALKQVGDKWSLMIICGTLANIHKFNELEKSLGINRNLLSSRLERLVKANIIEKKIYQLKPPRYEYQLTHVGKELGPLILELATWSKKNFT